MTSTPLPPSAMFCWPCGGRLVALVPHPDDPGRVYRPVEMTPEGRATDVQHVCHGPTAELVPR